MYVCMCMHVYTHVYSQAALVGRYPYAALISAACAGGAPTVSTECTAASLGSRRGSLADVVAADVCLFVSCSSLRLAPQMLAAPPGALVPWCMHWRPLAQLLAAPPWSTLQPRRFALVCMCMYVCMCVYAASSFRSAPRLELHLALVVKKLVISAATLTRRSDAPHLGHSDCWRRTMDHCDLSSLKKKASHRCGARR